MVDNDDGRQLQQERFQFLEILRLARDLKVDFAYPTQTLHHTFDHVPTEARPARVTPSDDELAALVRGFGPKGDRARPDGPRITSGFFAVATEGSSDDVSEDAGA